MISYYLTTYNAYIANNIILNIYKDTSTNIQNYIYEEVSNIINTISIYNTAIANDTKQYLLNYTNYVGVLDSINTVSTLINIAINAYNNPNPYDILVNPHLYAHYDKYYLNSSQNTVNSIASIFNGFISILTSKILYNDKFRQQIYNEYTTYGDVLYYIIINMITSQDITDLSILNNAILKPTYDLADNFITTYFNTTYTTNLNKLIQITKILITDYNLLTQNDIYQYSVYTTTTNNNRTVLENNLIRLITQTTPNFAWVKELGNRFMQSSTISIDDQHIETHNSDLMHLFYEIYNNTNQKSGLDKMLGNTPEMYTVSPLQKPIKRLYIPFYYWFCRNDGSAFPLVALLHANLNLSIDVNSLENLLYIDDGAVFNKIPNFKCSIVAEYVYLDDEERTKMINSKLEYLMERYIYNNNIKITKNTPIYTMPENEYVLSVPVSTINDPTKFLIWTVKCRNKQTEQTIDVINWQQYGYNVRDSLGDIKNIYPLFDKIKIEFDGRDRESYKDELYYTSVTPWSRYVPSLMDGEYMYSFGFFPLLEQPTGSANLGQLSSIYIKMKPVDEIMTQLLNGDIEIFVESWGCTYNILRIFSGLGGLSFYG